MFGTCKYNYFRKRLTLLGYLQYVKQGCCQNHCVVLDVYINLAWRTVRFADIFTAFVDGRKLGKVTAALSMKPNDLSFQWTGCQFLFKVETHKTAGDSS